MEKDDIQLELKRAQRREWARRWRLKQGMKVRDKRKSPPLEPLDKNDVKTYQHYLAEDRLRNDKLNRLLKNEKV